MKTSNKILLISLIVTFLISGITVIGAGVLFFYSNPSHVKFGSDSTEIISKEYSIENFDTIDLSGFLNVKIVRGEFYKISLSAPEDMLKYITLDKKGRTLELKQLFISGSSQDTLKVKITMPRLSGIESAGCNLITFSNFKSEKMFIKTKGYNQVKGDRSDIKNLDLSSSWIVDNDLDSCLVTNANLNLTGTGMTKLNMDGGKLNGHAMGSNTIIYRGSISEKDMVLSDESEIKKKDI